MVSADSLEVQLGRYVSAMELKPDVISATLAELQRRVRSPSADTTGQIIGEIERWRRLFVLGEIDEARYRREVAPLQRVLKVETVLTPRVDLEGAAAYLRDVGSLFLECSREMRRTFAHTVFERLLVDGKQLAEITPRPEFHAAFLADRKARFDGNLACVEWLPGQDSNLQPIG